MEIKRQRDECGTPIKKPLYQVLARYLEDRISKKTCDAGKKMNEDHSSEENESNNDDSDSSILEQKSFGLSSNTHHGTQFHRSQSPSETEQSKISNTHHNWDLPTTSHGKEQSTHNKYSNTGKNREFSNDLSCRDFSRGSSRSQSPSSVKHRECVSYEKENISKSKKNKKIKIRDNRKKELLKSWKPLKESNFKNHSASPSNRNLEKRPRYCVSPPSSDHESSSQDVNLFQDRIEDHVFDHELDENRKRHHKELVDMPTKKEKVSDVLETNSYAATGMINLMHELLTPPIKKDPDQVIVISDDEDKLGKKVPQLIEKTPVVKTIDLVASMPVSQTVSKPKEEIAPVPFFDSASIKVMIEDVLKSKKVEKKDASCQTDEIKFEAETEGESEGKSDRLVQVLSETSNALKENNLLVAQLVLLKAAKNNMEIKILNQDIENVPQKD